MISNVDNLQEDDKFRFEETDAIGPGGPYFVSVKRVGPKNVAFKHLNGPKGIVGGTGLVSRDSFFDTFRLPSEEESRLCN